MHGRSLLHGGSFLYKGSFLHDSRKKNILKNQETNYNDNKVINSLKIVIVKLIKKINKNHDRG